VTARIVDGHVHVGLTKYRPVEEYLADMDRCHIAQAVLVQYIGNADNSYLIRCVRAHPTRFAAVAMVDLDRADAPQRIDDLAATGTIAGVRLWAATRSPGPDRLAVWRAIERNGLVATVRGPFDQIIRASFAAIVDELPTLRVRLEHLGFFRYGRDDGFEHFLRLAQRPNVYTTWSGYYEYSADPYPHRDAMPYLERSLEAFGASRIMWSGDWNRSDLTDHSSPRDYPDAIRLITEHCTFLSAEQREWILGRTSARLFGLDGAAAR
jgi:predicted TIM-barrel fold metal-dependent hydrolase